MKKIINLIITSCFFISTTHAMQVTREDLKSSCRNKAFQLCKYTQKDGSIKYCSPVNGTRFCPKEKNCNSKLTQVEDGNVPLMLWPKKIISSLDSISGILSGQENVDDKYLEEMIGKEQLTEIKKNLDNNLSNNRVTSKKIEKLNDIFKKIEKKENVSDFEIKMIVGHLEKVKESIPRDNELYQGVNEILKLDPIERRKRFLSYDPTVANTTWMAVAFVLVYVTTKLAKGRSVPTDLPIFRKLPQNDIRFDY